MTARQQWTIVGSIVLILGTVLFAATRFLGDELFPVTVGSTAPDFQAVALDGAPVALSDYRGDWVLLNIWATWCVPCRTEMPSIQRLHERFERSGLRVVAVSVDAPGAGEAIRSFREEMGLTFDIVHDVTNTVQTAYQSTGVPETFLIDPQGMIRKKVIGDTDWFSPANQMLVAALIDDTTDVPRRDGGVASPVPVLR